MDYYAPLHVGRGAGALDAWSPPPTAVAQGTSQAGFRHVPPSLASPLAALRSSQSLPALRGVQRNEAYLGYMHM